MSNDNVVPIHQDDLLLTKMMNDKEFMAAIEEVRRIWVERDYPRQAIVRGVNINSGDLIKAVRKNLLDHLRQFLDFTEQQP